MTRRALAQEGPSRRAGHIRLSPRAQRPRLRRIPRRTRHGKRRGAQLRLLLGILRRLTTDDWTAAELAEDLGVTVRTAWRYLAAIRAQCPLERTRGPGAVSYHRLPRRWWETV